MKTTNALECQVGGNHYKGMSIEPVELTFMLNETFTFCNVAKYLTRVKDNPLQEAGKALHCVELEKQLINESLVGWLGKLKTLIPSLATAPPTNYTTERGKYKEHGFTFHQVESIIDTFTEDENIRVVLLSIHYKEYKTAIKFINIIIGKLNELDD